MRGDSSWAARYLAPALVFALTASSAGRAGAQSSAHARVEADRLFRDGKRLYDAGQYKEACDALAMSDELDPAIGTLGLLAACHEKQGDLVLARKEYLETARRAQAKKDDRAAFASQQAEALSSRIARLTIDKAVREPGLEVTRDGTTVLESELGVESRVNPGAHEIIARATGFPEWKLTVKLKEGERRVVRVPALDPSERSGSRWIPPRWLIWTSGGVGVAGIVAGSVSGVIAITNNTASLDWRTCKPATRKCAERETALTAATASTIGFAVGGAGLAAGTTFFLLARSSGGEKQRAKEGAASSTPRAGSLGVAPLVGSQGAGAVLFGAF